MDLQVANKKNVPPIPNAQVPNSNQYLNKILVERMRSMWTYQALEEAMDIVENGTCFLRNVSISGNICLSSLSDKLNNKSKKMGTKGVFT